MLVLLVVCVVEFHLFVHLTQAMASPCPTDVPFQVGEQVDTFQTLLAPKAGL